MEIKITGRHLDIRGEVKEYVSGKIDRLTKHFDGMHRVELTASNEGDAFRVEMVVHAVRGMTLAAEGKGTSLLFAIDQVVDRMDRQVRKLKERLKGHRG